MWYEHPTRQSQEFFFRTDILRTRDPETGIRSVTAFQPVICGAGYADNHPALKYLPAEFDMSLCDAACQRYLANLGWTPAADQDSSSHDAYATRYTPAAELQEQYLE